MHRRLGRRLALIATLALVAAAALSPAAASAAYPGTTTSVYEHSADPAQTTAQGCSAARRGESGVVILDYGRPAYLASKDLYGTIDFQPHFVWNGDIVRAAEGYARGYVSCLPAGSRAHVALATGTNNACSNHDSACCPRGCPYQPPSFTRSGYWWAVWVRRLDAYLHSQSVNGIRLSDRVRASAADDAEPAWEPAYSNTHDWLSSFASTTGQAYPLWDFGSLESGYWTPSQGYYVAYGTPPAVPFGEIYYRGQASEWESLALWSHQHTSNPMRIYGVTTQYNSAYAGQCGYTPQGSYDAMLGALQSNSATYQSSIPYETDTPCYTAG